MQMFLLEVLIKSLASALVLGAFFGAVYLIGLF